MTTEPTRSVWVRQLQWAVEMECYYITFLQVILPDRLIDKEEYVRMCLRLGTYQALRIANLYRERREKDDDD